MATNYRYSACCGGCTAIFQILMGLGSLGCGVGAIFYQTSLYFLGFGIWAGVVFYLLAGILGLASLTRKNGVVAGYYVLSLLSVFVAMAQMCVFSWEIYTQASTCLRSLYNDHDGYCSRLEVQRLIISSVGLLLGVLEWVFAMVACCVSCSCCSNSTVVPTQTVVIHTTAAVPMQSALPGQQQTLPGQQPAFSGQQPLLVGQPMGSGPVFAPPQPALDYIDKPQLSGRVPDDPPVYTNPTFDPVREPLPTQPYTDKAVDPDSSSA